jgi:2-methylcitrate dehydratase PrpD
MASDFPHSSAIFSFQFNVACALLNGDVQPEHFSKKAIEDPQLNRLINKTRCVEFLQGGGRSVEVVVKMKDGREYPERTDVWKGDPLTDPMPRNEIISKFYRQIDFSQTVSRDDADRLLNIIDGLEQLDDISVIAEMMIRQR